MSDFLFSLVALSSKASLVVLVVLAAQFLGRRWLPAGFRYGLWGLVALRLVVPSLPESPLSILQTTRPVAALPALGPLVIDGSIAVGASASPPAEAAQSSQLALWLLGLWGLGVVWFLGRRLLGHRDLLGLLRRSRPVTDVGALEEFGECRRLLGVAGAVHLLESADVAGPASCGLLRPTVLVPLDFFAQLSVQQRRHALLHEMAHLKRRDALGLHLAHLLVAVHWFNPFLWLALRRFESDLEMACDATVLVHLERPEHAGYGRTLLEVGIRPLVSTQSPCFAVDSPTQLTRRIRMITRFKKGSWRRTLILAALATALVTLTLTEMPTALATPGAEAVEASILAQDISAEFEKEELTAVEKAAKIAKMIESSSIEPTAIALALHAEAERLDLATRSETAGQVRHLATLLESRHGLSAERASRPGEEETKRTVSALRNAGTALYEGVLVPGLGEDVPRGATAVSQSFRWAECSPISHGELQEKLGADQELPRLDGWGGALDYCLLVDRETPRGLVGVRSAGRDGKFDGESYATGPFDPSDLDQDIVWINGFFMRWPQA